MPNQRDADKKLISAWVSSRMKTALEAIAKEQNMSLSSLLESLCQKVLQVSCSKKAKK